MGASQQKWKVHIPQTAEGIGLAWIFITTTWVSSVAIAACLVATSAALHLPMADI
jgi:hypothetical protein